MPAWTIEATIRASARFTLYIDADGEPEALAWARELLDSHSLNVDSALHGHPLDSDEGSVEIDSVKPAGIPVGVRVVTTGTPETGDWKLADGQ